MMARIMAPSGDALKASSRARLRALAASRTTPSSGASRGACGSGIAPGRAERSELARLSDGTFRSAKDLTAAIGSFIDAYNDRCQPFAWTKDTDELIAKIKPSKN